MTGIDRWIDVSDPPPWEDRPGRQAGSPFAEYDWLGRKQPRRLGLPSYLLLVARFDPARVRQVPARAVAQEGRDDVGEFADILCPCGGRPVARAELGKCSGCERYYTMVGQGAIYVCYGAMTPPSTGSLTPTG